MANRTPENRNRRTSPIRRARAKPPRSPRAKANLSPPPAATSQKATKPASKPIGISRPPGSSAVRQSHEPPRPARGIDPETTIDNRRKARGQGLDEPLQSARKRLLRPPR